MPAGGAPPSGSGRPGKPSPHDALAATRGVANVSHRRTWDEAEYAGAAAERAARDEVAAGESKAEARKRRRAERDPLQQGLIVERAALRSRDFDLDLTSKAGSRLVVGGTAPKSRQGGFYCAVCDCTLADSGSYLTHLNGRWHNRALGMSMSVERSTAAEVRDRLAAAAARKKKRVVPGADGGSDKGDELDRQLLLTAGPAESEEEDEEEEDGAGVAVGTKEVGAGPAPRPQEAAAAKPAPAAPPPPKLAAAKLAPAPVPVPDDEEEEVDPMMAAMGFTGFGSTAGG